MLRFTEPGWLGGGPAPIGALAEAPSLNVAPIDDTVSDIDEMVRWCSNAGDRRGFFAALYRHVAVGVAQGVRVGRFVRPDLIERLHLLFFERYATAFRERRAGRPCARSWEVAFAASDDPGTTLFQHLALGMNAHINFDLPIALAEVVSDEDAGAFEPDFLTMNRMLTGLLDVLVARMTRGRPVLRWAHELLREPQQLAIDLAMTTARTAAWDRSRVLIRRGPLERQRSIWRSDVLVADLGHRIWLPGPFAAPITGTERWFERRSVSAVISDLAEI